MSLEMRFLGALSWSVFAGFVASAHGQSGSATLKKVADRVAVQSPEHSQQVYGVAHGAYARVESTSGGSPRGSECGRVGPDLIVGGLVSVSNYGSEQIDGEWFDAFSVGPNRCNIGDQEVNWIAGTDDHPVFGLNLFRLKDGRFEQLGQSWLFHSYSALQSTGCCLACTPPGSSGRLGVGCLTTNSPVMIGLQSSAGPKWEVNAHTGVFVYPPDDPPWSGSTARRMRVRVSDLENTSGGQARFFVAGYCVAKDDAAAGNGNNNASYREVSVANVTFSSASFGLLGTTEREQAGIRAWQDVEPSVEETDIQIPNEGLIILAAKATDIGGGLWHYEYAAENLNSNRSVGSFSIPLDPASIVTNIGFHDVDYHSFDGDDGGGDANRDGTDWPNDYVVGASSITWSMVDVGANSNALRWGTLYSFRFDTDAEPGEVTVTMGLFEAGTPSSVDATTTGPVGSSDDCEPEFTDVGLFVSELLAVEQDPVLLCVFDSSGDGVLDGRDIQGFVDRLLPP